MHLLHFIDSIPLLQIFVKHFGGDIFQEWQKQYPDGRLSPIYYAVRNSDLEMLKFLMKYPLPPCKMDILQIAKENNDAEMAKYLETSKLSSLYT